MRIVVLVLPLLELLVGVAGRPTKCGHGSKRPQPTPSPIASPVASPGVDAGNSTAGVNATAPALDDSSVALANSTHPENQNPTTPGSESQANPTSGSESQVNTTTPGSESQTNATTPQANSSTSGSGPLFDTSATIVDRLALLSTFSESDIFAVVGEPVLVGPHEHHPLLREAIANVTRLSVMHAQQVRDVIGWRVPFSVNPDMSAPASFYNGSLVFLHSMIDEWCETTMSHEMGHAVFDHHGFAAPMAAAVKAAGLDDASYGDVTGAINEAFGDMWAERATVFKQPDGFKSATWDKVVAHSTAYNLDWILGNDDQTNSAWFDSLGLSKATVDKKALITQTADSVIFPRFAELYFMDQARGDVPE